MSLLHSKTYNDYFNFLGIFHIKIKAIVKKPANPIISVINVKNIFEAKAGSYPIFLKIKGIAEPNKFPIKTFPKTAMLKDNA